MKLLRVFFSSLVWVALIAGCDSIEESSKQSAVEEAEPVVEVTERVTATNVDSGPREYALIEWTDLIPEEDLAALLNPPSYITETEEGSLEDQISSSLETAMASKRDDPYQRALISKKVVSGFDRQAVKLAGFVVPLEFSDAGIITEFFLVPFFGACIHVPAPPPNQMIYVKHQDGFELEELYSPIWVSGILTTTVVENDIATSAYALDMDSFELYTEHL